MAENKKGFILYADQKDLFDQLPNDKAGELIKHIFSYVNDEAPKSKDIIINLAFTPIKQQLKRDLEKWEKQHNQRIEAGKKSAEVRKRNATTVNERSISSTVNDTVTVTVNDTVTKEDINKALPFSFLNSLLKLGADKQLVSDWIKVRKTKKLTNTSTAFNGFLIEFKKSGKPINEILTQCCQNSWGGFKASWKQIEDINSEQPVKLKSWGKK